MKLYKLLFIGLVIGMLVLGWPGQAIAGDEVCDGSNCVCWAQVKVNSWNCAVCSVYEYQCTITGEKCEDSNGNQTPATCQPYGGMCVNTCVTSVGSNPNECLVWSDFVDCNQSKGNCTWTGTYSDCSWSGGTCTQTNVTDTRWCCGPGSCEPEPPPDPGDPPPPQPLPDTPSCWVNHSAAGNRILTGQNVTVTANGYGETAGSELVEVYVVKDNGDVINPPPSAGTVTGFGNTYYRLGACNSVGGDTCGADMTWTGTLPSGNYYFFCHQSDVDLKCSGNPHCSYETENPAAPETVNCGSGWSSCGLSDNKYLTVDASAPYCEVVWDGNTSTPVNDNPIAMQSGTTSNAEVKVSRLQNGAVTSVDLWVQGAVTPAPASFGASGPYTTAIYSAGAGDAAVMADVYMGGSVPACTGALGIGATLLPCAEPVISDASKICKSASCTKCYVTLNDYLVKPIADVLAGVVSCKENAVDLGAAGAGHWSPAG